MGGVCWSRPTTDKSNHPDYAAVPLLPVARRDHRDLSRGERLLGFDFDCTLTTRHFYKVFAWGYANGNGSAHTHCEAFAGWCREHGVAPEIQKGHDLNAILESCDLRDPIGAALEDFCKRAGEGTFREVFREVFLGGSGRILLVAEWLARMQREGVQFAIVTAGISASVLRALTAVPEWQPFFPASHVWDVSQGRHSSRSVMHQKLLILRDICPSACRILLVDDSLSRDRPESWVLSAVGAEVYEGLNYEGRGIDAWALGEIEQRLFA